GFGTTDQSAWLWGLRHQVRFESLLGGFLGADSGFGSLLDAFSITTKTLPLDVDISSDDPRSDLKWFPRGGDNWGVDAANPGFSGTNFTHGNGPVMRMVMSLDDGRVGGVNIIPGGQSGLNDTDYFADQAELWLANEVLPMRFHPNDVATGAQGREVFSPPTE
ncbi:MAG: acyl-homoserine lactone acylase PvdQ, partial [Myxococcota bacterium]